MSVRIGQPTPEDTAAAKKMLAHLQERSKELEGNPAALLAAADDFCYEHERMMHLGDKKGEIVRTVIKELAPKTCLELGTYCGYSAVLMASVLPKGSRYITLEVDENSVAVAKQFIKWAGADVQEKITIVGKPSDEAIPSLRKDFCIDTLDFVFIDHLKTLYVRDLKLLEAHGLLREGTVVLADNIIFPGAPDYLEYVQNSERYKTELIRSTLEYSEREDALAKSTVVG